MTEKIDYFFIDSHMVVGFSMKWKINKKNRRFYHEKICSKPDWEN